MMQITNRFIFLPELSSAHLFGLKASLWAFFVGWCCARINPYERPLIWGEKIWTTSCIGCISLSWIAHLPREFVARWSQRFSHWVSKFHRKLPATWQILHRGIRKLTARKVEHEPVFRRTVSWLCFFERSGQACWEHSERRPESNI